MTTQTTEPGSAYQHLPVLLNERTNFSCFGNFITGTLLATVYDQGTDAFPAHVELNTDRGSGSLELTLSGNQTIKKALKGMLIIATITDWAVSDAALSFHIKVVTKRVLTCTITERTVTAYRAASSQPHAPLL